MHPISSFFSLHLLLAAPEPKTRTDRGLSPDIISFNAAINSCEIEGHWQTALHLFALSRFSNVMHDVTRMNFESTISRGQGSLRALRSSMLYNLSTDVHVRLFLFRGDHIRFHHELLHTRRSVGLVSALLHRLVQSDA